VFLGLQLAIKSFIAAFWAVQLFYLSGSQKLTSVPQKPKFPKVGVLRDSHYLFLTTYREFE
jgi:hypothetical protein